MNLNRRYSFFNKARTPHFLGNELSQSIYSWVTDTYRENTTCSESKEIKGEMNKVPRK
jgi:hypothetical protein